MADWFFGENGQQIGPMQEAEFHSLIASGRIGPSSMVWKEGMPDWLPLEQLRMSGASGLPHDPAQPVQMHYSLMGPEVSGLAIASLVCGILGLVSCIFPMGIPAVICGHMALSRISAAPFEVGGRGMAIWGLLCGYLAVLITLGIVGAMVTMFYLI